MEEEFYQVGGTLSPNSRSYIKRKADEQLYNNLKKGLYCYVLNARQVGKSSLRVSTSKRFEKEGYFCIHIDLSSIGKNNTTEEQWYQSVSDSIVEQLFFDEIDFLDWYEIHQRLSPVSRFSKFIDKFILDNISENIIIFIDEVDFILNENSDFSADDFFAVIRSFYNLRSENSKYKQLTFALFGVATPEDLMRDASRTPFNIAHNVTIEQFKIEESYSLAEGLGKQSIEGKRILKKIFSWTSGTPYLTQKILQNIAPTPIKTLDEIDRVVDILFIQNNFNEINISNIQNRILHNKKYNVGMLHLIGEILNGEHILADDKDLRHCYLQLSGLVKKDKGRLKYSNKIYRRVFNKQWLENELDKIDRPFSKDLNRWLELKRDNSALLSGEVLEKANEWAKNRKGLSPEEYSYLNRSREQERIREKHRIKEQTQAKNIKWLSSILFFMLIFVGIAYFYSVQSDRERQKAEIAKEVAEKEKRNAERAKEVAEREKRKAERAKELAEREKRKAERAKEIVEEQKRTLEENQKKFHILEEGLYSKEECSTYDKQCMQNSIQRELYAYRLLLPNNPLKYNRKISNLEIELGDNCLKNYEHKKAINSYEKALKIYSKLLEKKSPDASKKLAEISEKLGDSYQELNTSKAIFYYQKSLKFSNSRAKIERLYSKLGKDYYKEELYHDAELVYKEGFEQYKVLLQENPSLYIDNLAEKFFFLGKIYLQTNKEKKSFNALTKSLKLYKIKKIEMAKDKIIEIKKTIKKLSYKKKERKNRIKGWVYLGVYSNTLKTWKKDNFALKEIEPSLLNKKQFIAIKTINVREEGSISAKRVNGLHLGTIVKIKQHTSFNKGEVEYVWAFIEY